MNFYFELKSVLTIKYIYVSVKNLLFYNFRVLKRKSARSQSNISEKLTLCTATFFPETFNRPVEVGENIQAMFVTSASASV